MGHSEEVAEVIIVLGEISEGSLLTNEDAASHCFEQTLV